MKNSTSQSTNDFPNITHTRSQSYHFMLLCLVVMGLGSENVFGGLDVQTWVMNEISNMAQMGVNK